MRERRDYSDIQYNEWRKNVLKRDKYRCRFPGCTRRKSLNCHHIIRWSDNPLLRFEISNGISLCRTHHRMVTGNEILYSGLLQSLLLNKDILRFRIEMEKDKGG